MVTVVMILFMAVGCGGNSNEKTELSNNTTDVSFNFKRLGSTGLQKVSDITRVQLDVKKNDEFIYEGKVATKVDKKWTAELSLKKDDGPYVFATRAYKGTELIYRGRTETTETLPESLVLNLDVVTPETSVRIVPSLEDIKVYSQNDKEVRMRFTIANTKRDDIAYSFKGGGGEEENVDLGSIAPQNGTLEFSNSDEKTFNAIYTRPSVGTAKVKAILLLVNENGDEVTIPFEIPTYEEQNILINFPPEITKIHVLDEGDKFTVNVDVSDVDSSTRTYLWSVQRGANIVGTSATEETLSLDGYDASVNPNLCIELKVTDDAGASTKVGYCIKGKEIDLTSIKKTGQTTSYDDNAKDDGEYQKGFPHAYIRDDVKKTVFDTLTGLLWQDDEATKTVEKPWLTQSNYDAEKYLDTSGDTATTYCANLTMGGHTDWRLPTRKELQSLTDYGQYNPAINTTFENTASKDDWSSSDYYWSSSTHANNSNNAWIVSFKGGNQSSNLKNNNSFVRCVRAGQ